MVEQLTNLDMLDYAITVNIRPLDVMKEIERRRGRLRKTAEHDPALAQAAHARRDAEEGAKNLAPHVE